MPLTATPLGDARGRTRSKSARSKTVVLGLNEMAAAFRQLPELARDAYADVVRVTGMEIARNAAAKAPTGATGALKRAIGVTVNARTGQARVGIRRGFDVVTQAARLGRTGSAAISDGATSSRVHVPTKIGHLVEFGHKRGRGRAAAGAKPFIRPAAEAERAHFLARCRDAGKRIETGMANVGGRFL